ncbi:MAG TPA: ethanolamine ammonia-lyase subunit EutC [Burkholderiales bacterium]|nr:ethanolamine ammonia-lyase subunit EutC [Burkholderiales bacterium]
MADRVASPPSTGPDPWQGLRTFTAARIALGRAGGSIPTRPLLEFQLAHARARDAVERDLDGRALERALRDRGWDALRLHSAARDRRTFVQRPDLGRILSDESKATLEARAQAPHDAVLVIADGLSALAVERHAVPLLDALGPRLAGALWRLAPVCIVNQGRVAIGDEIGALVAAALAVMLIGERPGLSAPDSLGVYLTWDPLPGRTNAERNCISNIRPEGLDYALAAHKLFHLMTAARLRRRTGIDLKEDAPALPGPYP